MNMKAFLIHKIKKTYQLKGSIDCSLPLHFLDQRERLKNFISQRHFEKIDYSAVFLHTSEVG